MNKEQLYIELTKFIDKKNVLVDELMKNHTSFKIGGPADILVTPNSIEEVQKVVRLCYENDIPTFYMGNGSNLLVRDKGMRCVVIKIGENLSGVKIEGTKVIAQSGILLSRLSKMILRDNLKGFEFADGIPGSLGGAVTMNAGAYDGEMKDVVKRCKAIDKEGNLIEISDEDLQLGYRTSVIQKKNYLVLEVELELEKGDYTEIKKQIDDLTLKRTSKQPLHMPSAGSVFKRPPGFFAGKLIEDSNLKGYRIGGAQVSEKHAGFIVNAGGATAKDVLDLINHIQNTVKTNFDVILEPEIRIVGEE
ncbi:UDP-N-acetylmuramate dehydrogenase [Serpentinicella alkaliphila]|uniref:UDP-N-acetylenolpyruvoylglucosamine reductase n=1 Tax=Serpentinicella alkaliphila TaxID=1734049 RepID=A0A4R2UFT8_9FIRM|nr:UDP-N-acetylmuramate dehydrogenase [Serpentinicella alkaliphila]QUH25692.1 UDP-N-acetylmuramate dehydrogenase [Serpentinicella alkaliphila]TCQ06593.1 UDP-N-acetylmuramate dehydrogenase [Serpentinicella alkaliphila]